MGRLAFDLDDDEANDTLALQVVHLLNLTVVNHGAVMSREGHACLVHQCEMCHMLNDEHTAACPVPKLEDWLAIRQH